MAEVCCLLMCLKVEQCFEPLIFDNRQSESADHFIPSSFRTLMKLS